MSNFNNDEYIKTQVRKQVTEEVIRDCKQVLKIDHTLSEEDMKDLSFIEACDIKGLQEAIENKILDRTSLVLYYLTKIKKTTYNAVIEINPNVLEDAKKVKKGILSGIPILIKANIGTQIMHTSAGAAALSNFQCLEDSEVVKRLKEEGAIILGKTNLSEWANFMSTESSNGYSALGGQCKNPYGAFDVGGSSSGSAVSVALGLAPVALGTETAGSIIYPASQNAIFGLKPTLGRVSQDRIIPISKSHDIAGPMAKNIYDLYLLMKSISDLDTIDFTDQKPVKVGILVNDQITDYYRKEDQAIIEQIKRMLLSKNIEVEETKLIDQAFDTKVYDILKYEFREGVKDFLAEREDYPVKTIEDVLHFNESNLKKYAPYNHEIIKQACEEVYDLELIQRQIINNQKNTRQALDLALENYDFLLTLSNYSTSVYAPSGYPALCLPFTYRLSGEPVGMTLIAKNYDDEKLIQFGSRLQGFRKNP